MAFALLACFFSDGFSQSLTGLHFAEETFPRCIFFLQRRGSGLLDIVIADDDLYDWVFSMG